MSKKFLVIQTAFIGDVVLATALVEKLHQKYPESEIDFLVRKGNDGLLIGHPFLSELLVWDKSKNKYPNLGKLLRRIREKKYDAVINVQRFAPTGVLTAFSGAKEKIGFDKNPLSFLFTNKIRHTIGSVANRFHEIDRNQLLIRNMTDSIPARPRLYPTAADFEKVRLYQAGPYICIAPASVWFTKQYPKAKWVELIDHLPADLHIYLLGSVSDSHLCDELIKASHKQEMISNLCGKLTFLESAALMKGAAMNFVNDSAPLHFASAVNAPVTAIYCSTVPGFGFGPLSDRSFTVETRQELPCRPCGLHGYKACPLTHFACALTISNEQLIETLQPSPAS
jgi:lipopolysaccharide heptosyltransferase II